MPNVLSKPVIVAVDHGTTATRVAIYNLRTRQIRWVLAKLNVLGLDPCERNWFSAFSDVLIRRGVGGRRMTSARAAFSPHRMSYKGLSIVGDDTKDVDTKVPRHELIKLLPNGDRLYALKNDKAFVAEVMNEWLDHFVDIADQLQDMCAEENLEIVELVGTEPNHMNNELTDKLLFQNYSKAFNFPLDKIRWVGEAHAVGHAIITRKMPILEDRTILVVIDAGGMSINFCVLELFVSPGVPVAIAELDSAGWIGGSEIWEMAFSAQIRKTLEADYDWDTVDELDEIHQKFLTAWSQEKATVDPDEPWTQSVASRDHLLYTVDVSGDECRECFDKAFKNSLTPALQKMQDVALAHDGNIVVVFSGGTTHSTYVRHQINLVIDGTHEAFPELGHKILHKFTRDLNHWDYRSGIVAEGAAYATAKAMGKSLTTMVVNGAAFGVRVLDAMSPHGLSELVEPLYGAGVPGDVAISYPPPDTEMSDYGAPVLEVVCEAFKHSKRPRAAKINTRYTYDVGRITFDRKGDYKKIMLRHRQEIDGTDKLALVVEFVNTTGPRQRRRLIRDLDLQIDTNSGCVIFENFKVTANDQGWRKLPTRR